MHELRRDPSQTIQTGKQELKNGLPEQRKNENPANEYIRSHLSTIVELSADAIFCKTLDGEILSWNRGAERIFGYKADQIIGKNITLLCPDDKEKEIDEINNKIRSGLVFHNYETIRKGKNGKNIFVSLSVSPIRNERRKIIASLVIASNITHQKIIEKAAIESDQKFRNIYNYAPISIVQTNRSGNILSVNMAFIKLLGYSSKEEILKLNVKRDIYFDGNFRKQYLARYESGDLINGLDICLKKKDGTKIWAHLNSHIVRDSNGKEIYFENFLSDVTNQREAKQVLIEQERSYRALIESSIDPIYVMRGRQLLLVNPAWTKLFGYTEKEACSDNFDIINIIAPESREEIEKRIRNFGKKKSRSPIRYEMSALTKSGQVVSLEVSRAEIIWKGESAVQGIYRDITARKKEEALLVKAKESAEKSDRLKSEFLAQMSHEIRTPLNNILTYASLLKDELEDKIPTDLGNVFSVIDSSSHRLIRTIDLILNLSKIQSGNFETKFERLDLERDILEDIMLEFFPRAKSKKISLVFENKAENCTIHGDRYSVSQIFLNLIDNAIKFTEKGTIRITIDNYGKSVRASVTDTGIGMTGEYQKSVFKPFSQEHSDTGNFYPGIGLGLSLVKKYAEINNAVIDLTSIRLKGTAFKIMFEPYF